MNAIEISSLSKTYESGDEALKGIDLEIPKGSFEIYAVLKKWTGFFIDKEKKTNISKRFSVLLLMR